MRKKVCILAAVFVLILALCSCTTGEKKAAEDAKARWEKLSMTERYEELGKVEKQVINLQKALGGNTPYPELYRNMYVGMLTGKEKTDSLDGGTFSILREQAVFWYGKKEGISDTDAEVDQYVKDSIKELRSSEEFDLIDQAYRKSGITFEDSIWALRDIYKWQYIMSKVPNGDDDTLDQVIAQFKQSSDVAKVMGPIRASRKLLKDGVTDLDKIKAADIYY